MSRAPQEKSAKRIAIAAHAGTSRFERPFHVAVVGGGLAGCASALALAERGATVTLIEAEPYLGGRVGAWTDHAPGVGSFAMERGFHAFFRQYYNLRAMLRRVDPDLSCLTPLADYPIVASGGRVQSFADLPTQTPRNLIALVRRTPTLGLRDVLRIPIWPTLEMLSYEAERTFLEWDGVSAGAFLDALRFPKPARELLFDVFAHSFFNAQSEMSAAEMIKLFHFYFTGNPEGLLFDVANRPFDRAIWQPMGQYLRGLGANLRLCQRAVAIEKKTAGFQIILADNEALQADAVVCALTTQGLQSVVDASPSLDDGLWRGQIASLRATRRFAVWRFWTDRESAPHRAPFAGTASAGILDNIALYHLFQDESRAYVQERGGSVVEVHAYALPSAMTEQEIKDELWRNFVAIYPEYRGAIRREERFRIDRDCPSFACGEYLKRPGVQTPFLGLYLAGDFVKLDTPVALMEAAATSGFVAANAILRENNVAGHELHSVSGRGVLHRWAPRSAEKWAKPLRAAAPMERH
jgi:isorenieratene synthase